MALIVECNQPLVLLAEVYYFLRDNNVQAWCFDTKGDFTYKYDNLYMSAWFRPRKDLITTSSSQLIFGIIKSKDYRLTKSLYSFYHTRFAEMLLTNFDSLCNNITLTSLLDSRYDI